MWNFIKTILMTVLIKKNRDLGFKVVWQLLEAMDTISKVSKTNRDDVAVRTVRNIVRPLLKDLPEGLAQKAIQEVNYNKRSFNIKYDKVKGINGGIDIKF